MREPTNRKRPNGAKRPARRLGRKPLSGVKPEQDARLESKPRQPDVSGPKPRPKPQPTPVPKPGPGPKPKPKPKPGPGDGPSRPQTDLDGKFEGDLPQHGKFGAQPLLTFPMRLEYRIISKARPPMVLQTTKTITEIATLRRDLAKAQTADPDQARELGAKIRALSEKAATEERDLVAAELKSDTEIWLRWYPDDNFSQTGIAPPSEAETEALEHFRAHRFAGEWPKIDDDELAARWGALEALAGPARAVHLMRSSGQKPDPAWEDRIGRICGLPTKVELFGLVRGRLEPLGTGVEIAAQGAEAAGLVSYAPEAMSEATWLNNFDIALTLGMGTKLTTKASVDKALAADWIIAIGLSGATETDLTALIEDQIATGGIEALAQDTPTNNAPGVSAGAERDDSVAGRLYQHTARELGTFQTEGLDAPRLATLLAQPDDLMQRTPGTDHATHFDAAAMIRAIGPALLDGSAAATTQLNGVEDTDLVELIAQHVQASGLYPAMRFGDNAYGILPVSTDDASVIIDNDFDDTERKYANFIRGYANGVGTLLSTGSEARTLRLEPGDPDASDKLIDILKTSQSSRRLDVSDEGADAVAGLACPYVAGKETADKPASYFAEILTKRLRDLDEPDESNHTTPLLYRLAHLSLRRIRILEVLKSPGWWAGRRNLRQIQGNWKSNLDTPQSRAVTQSEQYRLQRFSTIDPSALDRIPATRRKLLQEANERYAEAIARLRAVSTRPDGTARLETLMMEVIDLFQYRLDAWITGLASIRLHHQREKAGASGLALGYFGFLGPLRQPGKDGPGGGYLQAPSQGQAVSAAILRSAFMRNRAGGAFEIDLSSRRTRGALNLIDHIRRGVPLPVCLGLRGERWLRNHLKSAQIGGLRSLFPLENADTDGTGTKGRSGTRCFDGLALIEADTTELTPDQRAVRSQLATDLDALADIVVAEAVHHRAHGSAEVAAAWLRVLSGGPIPHRPEFLRTQRSGHASDYRVSVALPQTEPAENDSPLRTAEYGLAALFDRTFPALPAARIRVEIALGEDTLLSGRISLDEAGIDAMTAGRLGLASLLTRLKSHAIARLNAETDFAVIQKLDLVPDLAGLEAAGATITLQPGAIEADVARAESLWKLSQSATALSPGDLSAAANPANPLDEPAHIAALNGAAVDLWARVDRLADAIETRQKAFAPAYRTAFKTVSDQYEATGRAWGVEQRADRRLQTRVVILHTALADLAGLQLDGATDPLPAAPRLVTGLLDLEPKYIAINTALKARVKALRAASRQKATATETLAEAREDIAQAIEALRAGMGLSKLSIFAPFAKSAALTPLLEPATTAQSALGDWPRYRAKLSRLLEQLGAAQSAYAVRAEATADDAIDDAARDAADQRPETLAPRAYHRGVFLGAGGDISAASISGMVIDEWVETRPATEQQAAIALNYDAPQAQAPNVLMLCVPSQPALGNWTAARAAAHALCAIELMKMRALTTQTTLMDETVLPLANLVAHLGSGANERPRLPVRKYHGELRDWFEIPGLFRKAPDIELERLERPWSQTRPFGPTTRSLK